jgi:hypothetical protein
MGSGMCVEMMFWRENAELWMKTHFLTICFDLCSYSLHLLPMM